MEKVGKGGGTLCREKLRPPASTTRSLGTSAVSTQSFVRFLEKLERELLLPETMSRD
jgi:hypothetical protein